MTFNNQVSVNTDEVVLEEGNPFDERKAEMMLAMKTFKSKLHHEPEAAFVVETGSDGKIVPLPARPAAEN